MATTIPWRRILSYQAGVLQRHNLIANANTTAVACSVDGSDAAELAIELWARLHAIEDDADLVADLHEQRWTIGRRSDAGQSDVATLTREVTPRLAE